LSTALSNHLSSDLAFGIVKVGSTNIMAEARSDTLELAAGANIVIAPDATNDKVTISAPKTAGYAVKWRSADGYDIAGFNSAGYGVGIYTSPGGGIAIKTAGGSNNWMYSICVKALSSGTVSIPVPRSDKTPHMFVDGTEKTLSNNAFSWTVTAGQTYLVQFTCSMSMDPDTTGLTIIGDWIDGVIVAFDHVP
jgi:hypothetical protein